FFSYSSAENAFREADWELIERSDPDLGPELGWNWEKSHGSHVAPPFAGSEDSLPGVFYRGLITVLPKRIALYNALPTEGMPQRSVVYSLTWPDAYWTIKAVDLETGRFCTVVSNVFGPVEYVRADVRDRLRSVPPAERDE